MEFLSTIDPGTWALFISFWGLVIATATVSGGVAIFFERKKDDWILDGISLFVQGALIPLLQVFLVATWLTAFAPGSAGSVEIHPVLAFALCFVGVDYLYYWNHRILHTKPLWPVHLVHHTAGQMDVLTTSRNTVWSSLLIVYLWINGALVYLLADPAPYVAAITLTAVLDLWRHSPLQPRGLLERFLGGFLILPRDHAWHHSQDIFDVNFGANINLWDKLHGTWHPSTAEPQELGVKTNISLVSRLLWPFE
jgi:sterol desaturase/sphingolipid hydroxylase (fatty acid hydroxylase superfamily)